MKAWVVAVFAAWCVLASGAASALDGVAVEAGHGDGADLTRVSVQSTWQRQFFRGDEWHVGGYWDFDLARWRRSVAAGQNGDITEIGATPVFRFERNSLRGLYAEAGIGFHLLSHTSLGVRRFSTAFQFGDHLGFGYRFGRTGAFDLGFRFQHLSNASIKRPNSGINFSIIRLQYHF